MSATDPVQAVECPTPGCPGDGRYAAPGRRHLVGCRHPVAPSPEFGDVIAVVQSRAISIEDAWAVLSAAGPHLTREAKAAALREWLRRSREGVVGSPVEHIDALLEALADEWDVYLNSYRAEVARLTSERDALAARLTAEQAASVTYADQVSALAARLAAVEALAERYEADARSEGYGGELWSTTGAAIRAALATGATADPDPNPDTEGLTP